MSSAVIPSSAANVRVNLMPRSEIARRERDGLVRGWVWGVLGAIVVAALIIAAAFWLKYAADQRLAAEQARTNNLLIELASLGEVSQALAAEQELTTFRTEAMAVDLAWAPVLAKVTGVLPDDTTVTGFDLTVGAAPTGDDPTAQAGVTGTVSFDSPTPLDIVPLIRSLRGVEGVLYADGQSVSSDSEGRSYSYLLNVTFDQSVYSGQYAAAEEGGE
jgi:hypothetical protein